jgi:hypothetical protein
MKRFLLFFIVALFVIAVPAFAATTTWTKDFNGIPNCYPILTFNKFDTNDGLLSSIEVILYLQANGGHIVINNDSSDSAIGTFEFGANAILDSCDVKLRDNSPAPQPVPGQAQCYNFLPVNLNSPSDENEYNGGTVSDLKSGYVGNSFWDPYQGSGTYNIIVSVSQWSDYKGTGDIEYSIDPPVTTYGYITVVYEYTPIPEPATITLFCTGTLAFLKRKSSK